MNVCPCCKARWSGPPRAICHCGAEECASEQPLRDFYARTAQELRNILDETIVRAEAKSALLITERDEWKARAEDAESTIASLREDAKRRADTVNHYAALASVREATAAEKTATPAFKIGDRVRAHTLGEPDAEEGRVICVDGTECVVDWDHHRAGWWPSERLVLVPPLSANHQPPKEFAMLPRLFKLVAALALVACVAYLGSRSNEGLTAMDQKLVQRSLTKAEELKALAAKVERLRANPATAAMADAAQADYERLAAEVRGKAARAAAEGALREDQAAQEAAARRDALGQAFEGSK